MKKIIALMTLLQIFSAEANSCLKDKSCFEHEGKIIDLKSNYLRDFDVRSLDQQTPVLSEQELKRILGEKHKEYFIPFDVEGSDLAILAGALSLGTVVMKNDREIMDFIQETKDKAPNGIGDFGFFLGGRQGVPSVAAGAYFLGAVMDNGKLKKIGIYAVPTGIATQIVTDEFKKYFKRNRPIRSQDPYNWGSDSMSFLSGHASGAFSMATVIAEVYKDKPAVPYIAYGLATVVAYARMYDKAHWASDVMGGAILGHLLTKIMIRTMENSERGIGSGFIVTPSTGFDAQGGFQPGVTVAWTGKRKIEPFECNKLGLTGSDYVKVCVEEMFYRSN